jgi:hypothetical protein
MTVRRNPLLAHPPVQYHKLSNTSRFRWVMGREPLVSDYHGVHTTDDDAIAAAYAIATWVLRGEYKDDMPVLVRLNTDGLEPIADVDAMLQGFEFYNAARPEIAKQLRDGASAEEIERSFDDYEGESEIHDLIGSDPAAVIFDDILRRPPNLISLLLEYGGDDAVGRFAAGEIQPPDRALSEVVSQRRYIADFDLDRIVGIDAVQPWWGEIVNEDEEDAVDTIASAGWDVITFDDAASGNIQPTLRCIYGAARGGEHDYHGTTVGAVRAAFPGITLRDGFKCEPRQLVAEQVTARGEDVDDADDEGGEDDEDEG